jgi:molecular chaperone GrpE (heat shock protein)
VAADSKFPGSPFDLGDDGDPRAPSKPADPNTRAVDVETLRQALAELEDAKQRLRRDNERELERLKARVLDGLLPVLDNLERSIEAAESSRNVTALLDGMKLVHGQFLGALAPYGLERVSAVGTRFDPSVHDAVAIIPVNDPAQDGVVVSETEPAYRVGGRVVRPAKVQVGRARATGPPN